MSVGGGFKLLEGVDLSFGSGSNRLELFVLLSLDLLKVLQGGFARALVEADAILVVG